jgi:hypothetical protein
MTLYALLTTSSWASDIRGASAPLPTVMSAITTSSSAGDYVVAGEVEAVENQ